VLKNPLGTFLVMQNGTIQQHVYSRDSISIIQFQSYAFDMSTFGGAGAMPVFKATERATSYLLSPDPNDPEFQKRPGSFHAELHDRISSPLYALLFAILPVMALGQAQTTRQGRGAVILAVVLIASGIRIGGLVLSGAAATHPALVPALYALPVGSIAIALALTLKGFRFSASDSLVSAVVDLFRRLPLRRRAAGQAA
jgi:lipopolysaccharide export system permease protein